MAVGEDVHRRNLVVPGGISSDEHITCSKSWPPPSQVFAHFDPHSTPNSPPIHTHPPQPNNDTMRQKRAKAYKRVMALYVSTFGFRQPYQVLLSDEFLLEAAKQKDVDWWKMLGTTVQGEVKPSE